MPRQKLDWAHSWKPAGIVVGVLLATVSAAVGVPSFLESRYASVVAMQEHRAQHAQMERDFTAAVATAPAGAGAGVEAAQLIEWQLALVRDRITQLEERGEQLTAGEQRWLRRLQERERELKQRLERLRP